MTVIIPTKLKNMVERYLMACDRRLEMGGYFFGSKDVIKAFLPYPNASPEAWHQHITPQEARRYGDLYSKMIGEPIVADMHTHPNGTVPSEKDGKYVRGMAWPYHILISDKQTSFEWFVIDSQLRHISHMNNEMEVEVFATLAANEMGITSLGQVFVTPKGEILGKPEAKRLLTIDQDYYRLEEWAKKRKSYSYRHWSNAEASRELGISTDRVKKARAKLEAK